MLTVWALFIALFFRNTHTVYVCVCVYTCIHTFMPRIHRIHMFRFNSHFWAAAALEKQQTIKFPFPILIWSSQLKAITWIRGSQGLDVWVLAHPHLLKPKQELRLQSGPCKGPVNRAALEKDPLEVVRSRAAGGWGDTASCPHPCRRLYGFFLWP